MKPQDKISSNKAGELCAESTFRVARNGRTTIPHKMYPLSKKPLDLKVLANANMAVANHHFSKAQ